MKDIKNLRSDDYTSQGDNNSDVNSSSGDIVISWNNFWEIETSSWDVKIKWFNESRIETSSWDISISLHSINSKIKTTSWDVTINSYIENTSIKTSSWNITFKNSDDKSIIETSSGDVKVKNNNYTIIETSSWKVEIKEDNEWEVKTSSWNIQIVWINFWKIKSSSWNLILFRNNGDLVTKSWDIEIKNFAEWHNLKIVKSGLSVNNNSIYISWWNLIIDSNDSKNLFWMIFWNNRKEMTNLTITLYNDSSKVVNIEFKNQEQPVLTNFSKNGIKNIEVWKWTIKFEWYDQLFEFDAEESKVSYYKENLKVKENKVIYV